MTASRFEINVYMLSKETFTRYQSIQFEKDTYLADVQSVSVVDAGADVLLAGKLSLGIIFSVIGLLLR